MTNADFNSIVAAQMKTCMETLCHKGAEYAPDDNNRLKAFEVAAALQGVTPIEAMAGMMAKHTVSVYDMIAHKSKNLVVWDEKITDSINYLLILKSMILDAYGSPQEDINNNDE